MRCPKQERLVEIEYCESFVYGRGCKYLDVCDEYEQEKKKAKAEAK